MTKSIHCEYACGIFSRVNNTTQQIEWIIRWTKRGTKPDPETITTLHWSKDQSWFKDEAEAAVFRALVRAGKPIAIRVPHILEALHFLERMEPCAVNRNDGGMIAVEVHVDPAHRPGLAASV